MKLTFVAPATDISRRPPGSRPRGTSYFHYYKLGLATVAAVTPPEIDIEVIDEVVDHWNPETHDTDAVAISVLTALAPRAYTLAAIFRARGITVILGGLHPTALPGEAAAKADAIVTGWGRNRLDASLPRPARARTQAALRRHPGNPPHQRPRRAPRRVSQPPLSSTRYDPVHARLRL
ncbi:MAG: hypothetical protein M5R36_04540 [Deltaproteobacteria bacterium]|nr:hypothetical protein [Deltaproteobacteria bacterium]